MNEIVNVVRQLFLGKRVIEEKVKYLAISILICSVHLVYMIAFYMLRVKLMFMYNIGAVVFYMIISVLIALEKKQPIIYILTFVEIMFHSVLATVMVGWDCGFMLYTISMIPLAFYVCYTIPYIKRGPKIPTIVTVVVFVSYFYAMIRTDNAPPILEVTFTAKDAIYMYYFNTFLTFAYIWTISTLFILEVSYMQRTLESENTDLEKLANFDPLTKLMNRRSLNNHLKEALENAMRTGEVFSLIMTDIDDFKAVNDTYGHEAGDEILVNISRILINNVRETDYVCRWGGEEMLLLIKAEKDVACHVAERIREDVEKTRVTVNGHNIGVTMTLGVSSYKPGDNIRSMVQKADICLYEGKNSGKNKVVKN